MPLFYLIELFSGTGSFGKGAQKVAREIGYQYQGLSVDIHPKYHPTTCIDILDWDYQGAIRNFLKSAKPSDIIWVHASPPCNSYSYANTKRPRDFKAADAIVKRALRIIKYVRPNFWTLENPVGHLQNRPFMQRLEPYKEVTSYCKFGRGFRKNTNIWTNVDLSLPVCEEGTYCAAKQRDGKHGLTAQTRESPNATQGAQGTDALYSIPQRLCKHIIRTALV